MTDTNSEIATAVAATHARARREQERASLAPVASVDVFTDDVLRALAKGLVPFVRDAVREGIAKFGPEPLGPLLKSRVQRLEERIRELEARPHLWDAGIWNGKADYDVGAVVTHDGSCWISRTWHRNERPGTGDCWRLLVKRGRDGKDSR